METTMPPRGNRLHQHPRQWQRIKYGRQISKLAQSVVRLRASFFNRTLRMEKMRHQNTHSLPRGPRKYRVVSA